MTLLHPANLKHQAARDLSEGQSELLKQLKRTPASELHNVEPALLARLTAQQRRDLFSKTASMPRQTPIRHRTVKPKRSRPRLPRRAWNALPNFIKTQIVASITSATVTAAGFYIMTRWPEISSHLHTLNQFNAQQLLSFGQNIVSGEF